MSRKATVAALSALLVLTGAVAAAASVPNPDGTISGCVNNSTGALRVIDPTKTGTAGHCTTTGPKAETAITWAQQGPAGVPGPSGPAGPQGPAGIGGPTVYTWQTAGFVDVTAGVPTVAAQTNDALPTALPFPDMAYFLALQLPETAPSPVSASCQLEYQDTTGGWTGFALLATPPFDTSVSTTGHFTMQFPADATGRIRLDCLVNRTIAHFNYQIQLTASPTAFVTVS
ncbi:MAG TPA: hypothetical protein VKB69_14125 [Micromonosporaceae bacterium]|nr:hypothetical protein [Micromonosporaceae bacterium]